VRKALVVARAEYLRAVRTKAFIIGIVLMPILMGAGFVIIGLAESIDEATDRHFAVIDRSGELYPALAVQVEERNRNQIWSDDEPPVQEDDRFLIERYEPEEAESYSMTLGDRVRDGELIGYLVIGKDLVAREGDDRVLDWHTQTPTYDDLPDWLESVINNEVRSQRMAASGLDPMAVAKVTQRVWVTEKGLARVTKAGKVKEAEKTDKVADMVVPLVLSIMIYMLVMMSAPQLMNNVLEEKMQKIAEVLVASVPPFELLLGKLMSALAVAMTLSVIYVGAGLVFVHTASNIPPTVPEALTAGVLLRFLFFEAVALVIYGSVFAALGSACTEIQDSQTLIGPAMLIFIMPMMFLGVVLKNPDSTVSRLISFFPPATPILMFLRSVVPPGVAVWELITAMVVAVLFALLCVKCGAKIFRVGLLSQGQTANYRQILRWVFEKS